MPSIKVHKVADIIDGKIVFSGKKSLIKLANTILQRLGLDLSDPSFGVRTYLCPPLLASSTIGTPAAISGRSPKTSGVSRVRVNPCNRLTVLTESPITVSAQSQG
jgi:hypothetical protein